MLLSDLGAEVIKVEEPGLGDYMRATPPTKGGTSPAHETTNRNKLSIGINLKKEEGKKVLRRLIRTADVFLEGFRPGAMARLGFSYRDVVAINRRIVYCSISSFGQRDSHSQMPAHDINFQAVAGSLAYSRRPQVPMLQLGDMVSGLYAALGIAASLAGNKRPVHIDVPIVQSLLSTMVVPVASLLATGSPPTEGSSLVFGSDPYYRLFSTADRRYVAVAAIEEEFWRDLLRKLGLRGLEGSRFGDPAERSGLASKMEAAFASRTRDEWSNALRSAAVTPVLDLKEALESSWARDSLMLRQVGGQMVLNSPLRTNPKARTKPFKRAPRFGEQTDDILRELRYKKAEVRRLRQLKAVE